MKLQQLRNDKKSQQSSIVLTVNSSVLKMFGVTVVVLLVTVLTTILAYFKWSYQYWKNRSVPFFPPTIPFGNLENPLRRIRSDGEHMRYLYKKIKENNWKYAGVYLFSSPHFFPVDLNLLKNILTKDFAHFTDRGTYVNEEDDPLSGHLFALGGTKWRNMRTKLTPTFTSGKMKAMFQTLVDCGVALEDFMRREVRIDEPIDIKEVLSRFTTDIIGSCAFGLDCKAMEDEDAPIRVFGRKFFKRSFLKSMKIRFLVTFPKLAKKLHMRFFGEEVTTFFMNLIRDTVNYRKTNNIHRKDFLQLLMDIKSSDGHDGLTLEEMSAQSFVFFIAGFETSSTTMTFALYQLAKNQDIQDKVREEIATVLAQSNGVITYDAIQSMTYLNQVIEETLRLHPPVPFVTRQCVKEYNVPNDNLTIEEGIKAIIPILGLHHDPEYFPEPETFNPDRFSTTNKTKIPQYAYIPFGEGPRICIGLRFGIMQSKVGLVTLLKNYRFTVNKKTIEPLKMKKNMPIQAAEGDIHLNAVKV